MIKIRALLFSLFPLCIFSMCRVPFEVNGNPSCGRDFKWYKTEWELSLSFISHIQGRFMCNLTVGPPYRLFCILGFNQPSPSPFSNKYYYNTTQSMVGWIQGCRTADMEGQLLSYTWIFICVGVCVLNPLVVSRVNCHLIKNYTKDLNRHFSKEVIQMANRYMKKGPTLLIIEKYKAKPQWDIKSHTC